MLKQPKGFAACFTSELSDRMSFYGLASCIMILLMTSFHQTAAESYLFYGELTGLGFITPVMGGILADRLYRRLPSVILGLLFILIGNVCLILPHFETLLWGMAFMIMGIGLMKPNDLSLVAMLYPPFSAAKEKGITFFYLGMNCGAILGPFILGIIFYFTHRYHLFFGLTALFLLGALFLFKRNYHHFVAIEKVHHVARTKELSTPLFILLSLLLVGLIYTLLKTHQFFNGFFIFMLVGVAVYITHLGVKMTREERRNMFFVLMLCFFSIFYFACSTQTGGALVLFSQIYSKHAGIHFPPEWAASIEPLSIIFLSPLLIRFANRQQGSHFNVNIILWKVAISLGVTSLAYVLFYIGSITPGFVAVPITVILGNILIGLGELLITTTLFSTIANFIGEKHRGFFMSLYMLSVAISSYLGSLLAMIMVGRHVGSSDLQDYPHLFLAFAFIAAVITVLSVCLMPVLRRLVSLGKYSNG
jgi:proton-dependent oligopeptide transporter, POT family